MASSSPLPWICAQLGSREHYAIPRVLRRSGRLALLLTDYWATPGRFVERVIPGREASKLRQRFHPELSAARIGHLGLRRPVFDVMARLRRWDSWRTTMERNRFFQQRILAQLEVRDLEASPGIFFTYSYAGSKLIERFKTAGWKVVLGQMDPGRHEERLVAGEHLRFPGIRSYWRPAPQAYWDDWREECRLSDAIVVNSRWSAEALESQGIESSKVRIVPLAYETEIRERIPPKDYPPAFSEDRPLRVLFLGQFILRKGAHLVIDAARRLRDRPFVWDIVGPSEIERPPDLAGVLNWTGAVSRGAAAEYYAGADVFILPTLSDGFALTQLEAQAHRLPVIASRFCGEVVREGENGIIVDPLDAGTIVRALERCIADPGMLRRMSQASRVDDSFSLNALERNLLEIERSLSGRDNDRSKGRSS